MQTRTAVHAHTLTPFQSCQWLLRVMGRLASIIIVIMIGMIGVMLQPYDIFIHSASPTGATQQIQLTLCH